MNKKGFTLVELLMVVIIIGILVTLAVPNYYRSVERAKGGKAKAAMDAIRKANLQYRAYYDTFATDCADLQDFDLPEDLVDQVDAQQDWSYGVTGDASTMLITATRTGGPNDGGTMTMDQDGTIDNSSGAPEWGA